MTVTHPDADGIELIPHQKNHELQQICLHKENWNSFNTGVSRAHIGKSVKFKSSCMPRILPQLFVPAKADDTAKIFVDAATGLVASFR